MPSLSVAVLALAAPLTLAKPFSHSQRTSNTFTNTTLEDMTATDMEAPTSTASGVECFETYVPMPDETCGELAADYGIQLSSFEADYAADSDYCETMLSGQGFCASKESEDDGNFQSVSVVFADATVTLDDFGNPASGPVVTPAPREAPEPTATETTITFSAMTTLTYTIGTGTEKQERTKVITHTDLQVETFALLNAVATETPSAASVGTAAEPSAANVTTVTVHDTQTTSVISTTTVLSNSSMLANASSSLTSPRTLKGTPLAATRAAPAATLTADKLYRSYTGNGTVAQGWPSQDQWLSFEDLFKANKQHINDSCDAWEVARNSADEMSAIEDSILDVANSTGVDSRFILATMMQSSSGCVRAVSTASNYLAAGLMQSPNGANTCNQNAAMLSSLSDASNVTAAALDPCPPATIHQMILDGTNGTSSREGLAQLLEKPGAADDVSRFYRAARWYNGGGVDKSGDLGKGCCVSSFASDIANRLTGWTGWQSEFMDQQDS